MTEHNFTDIDGHWAEASIMQAVCDELVHGYPEGTFTPDETISRAEFVVMIADVFRWQNEEDTLSFTDYEQIPAWARQAIAQAVEAEAVVGYEDGRFRPDAEITRAEIAAIIARVLSIQTVAVVNTSFADDGDIPAWAKGSVEAIRSLGIVVGRGDNHFVPHEAATRAETTVILLKMLEHL